MNYIKKMKFAPGYETGFLAITSTFSRDISPRNPVSWVISILTDFSYEPGPKVPGSIATKEEIKRINRVQSSQKESYLPDE
ncbi:MAG: hypothetical protein RLZZ338_3561 [Cyanobacteriota bacterium]|jgi:hypothetical protein